MPKYTEVPRPPVFRGTEAERWRTLYTYLYRLAEHLENVINNEEGGKQDDGNMV